MLATNPALFIHEIGGLQSLSMKFVEIIAVCSQNRCNRTAEIGSKSIKQFQFWEFFLTYSPSLILLTISTMKSTMFIRC